MFHQNLGSERVFSRQLSKDLLYDASLSTSAKPTTYFTRHIDQNSVLSRPRPRRYDDSPSNLSISSIDDNDELVQNAPAPLRIPSDTIYDRSSIRNISDGTKVSSRLSNGSTAAGSARYPSTTTLSMVPNDLTDIDEKEDIRRSSRVMSTEDIEHSPIEEAESIEITTAKPVIRQISVPEMRSQASNEKLLRQALATSPPSTAYSNLHSSTPVIYIQSATTTAPSLSPSAKRKRAESPMPIPHDPTSEDEELFKPQSQGVDTSIKKRRLNLHTIREAVKTETERLHMDRWKGMVKTKTKEGTEKMKMKIRRFGCNYK